MNESEFRWLVAKALWLLMCAHVKWISEEKLESWRSDWYNKGGGTL